MKRFLAEMSRRQRLAVALACSILLHLSLVAIGVLVKRVAPPTFVAKKGDSLFVEFPKPDESASPGDRSPARPPQAPPAPPVPKAPVSKPSAPKMQARPAPQKVVPPEPTQVAKAAPAEPEQVKPTSSAPPVAPEQRDHLSTVPGAPAEAHSAPGKDAVASLPKEPGAGGPGRGGLRGLRRGLGGIEGDPIPLDTPNPLYSPYFQILKRLIEEKWGYPREAAVRGIDGQLEIVFIIAKSGWLEAIELRHSSGAEILDRYALNAIKLAHPFPPIPDSVDKKKLLISAIFVYSTKVDFVRFLR